MLLLFYKILVFTLLATGPEITEGIQCFPETRIKPAGAFGAWGHVWIEDNRYVNASFVISNLVDYYTPAELEAPLRFSISVALSNAHHHPFVWASSPGYFIGYNNTTCRKRSILRSIGFQLPRIIDSSELTTATLYVDKYFAGLVPEPHLQGKIRITKIEATNLPGPLFLPPACGCNQVSQLPFMSWRGLQHQLYNVWEWYKTSRYAVACQPIADFWVDAWHKLWPEKGDNHTDEHLKSYEL